MKQNLGSFRSCSWRKMKKCILDDGYFASKQLYLSTYIKTIHSARAFAHKMNERICLIVLDNCIRPDNEKHAYPLPTGTERNREEQKKMQDIPRNEIYLFRAFPSVFFMWELGPTNAHIKKPHWP